MNNKFSLQWSIAINRMTIISYQFITWLFLHFTHNSFDVVWKHPLVGFGCNLYSSGNTIFAENLYISQEERIERIKSKQAKLTWWRIVRDNNAIKRTLFIKKSIWKTAKWYISLLWKKWNRLIFFEEVIYPILYIWAKGICLSVQAVYIQFPQ